MEEGRMTAAVWLPAVQKVGLTGLAAALLLTAPMKLFGQQNKAASAGTSPVSSQRQFLDRYCVTCHNERLMTGGLSLIQADPAKPGAQPELWEKVVRKLRTGVMPPPNALQPSEPDRLSLLSNQDRSRYKVNSVRSPTHSLRWSRSAPAS